MDISAKKKTLIREFRANLARARNLRTRLATDGFWRDATGKMRPLSNPDKRDATVFIFFETAAAFESFSQEVFVLAIRRRFRVGHKVALKLGGRIDDGIVFGWGAPPEIVKRAKSVFGKQHFLSRLSQTLPTSHYEWLAGAHRMRNRIAHSSEQAKDKLKKIHNTLGIPVAQRQGAGPGRILSDYPATSLPDDKWFHRFLLAYENFCDLTNSKL
jgi:hypothetical protein